MKVNNIMKTKTISITDRAASWTFSANLGESGKYVIELPPPEIQRGDLPAVLRHLKDIGDSQWDRHNEEMVGDLFVSLSEKEQDAFGIPHLYASDFFISAQRGKMHIRYEPHIQCFDFTDLGDHE